MTYIRLSFFAAVATAATPHGRFGRLLGGSECPRAWTNVTAADYVTRINPGWNLGNTLDALPNEGSWNNPPVVAKTFDDINDAGFKSVRIPGRSFFFFPSFFFSLSGRRIPFQRRSSLIVPANTSIPKSLIMTTTLAALRIGPSTQPGCNVCLMWLIWPRRKDFMS